MSWRQSLRNHPFEVDAHFEFSLVLTYALPAEVLQPMLPAGLELDCFQERWAFVAIAMVQTKQLCPTRLPSFFGRDFFLIGTRLFVRFPTADGRRLRGLYIIRSQTNRAAMRILGDVFTRYRYDMIDVDVVQQTSLLQVKAGAFDVEVDASAMAPDEADVSQLPVGSPLSTWKDARRFAGPMPYTFSALPDNKMLIVEGVRQQWQPRPVRVVRAEVPFFAERQLPTPQLASAFVVENVPYHWKAGRIEPCP
jgi:hypothetical protein